MLTRLLTYKWPLISCLGQEYHSRYMPGPPREPPRRKKKTAIRGSKPDKEPPRRMSRKKRARVAAAARWKDPDQRKKAAQAMRDRMLAAWAVVKALEKVKEAA
jgi:hypothetical protein